MIGLRTNVRSEVALDCVKFFSSCRLKSLLEPRDEERTLSEVAILSTYPMVFGPDLHAFEVFLFALVLLPILRAMGRCFRAVVLILIAHSHAARNDRTAILKHTE